MVNDKAIEWAEKQLEEGKNKQEVKEALMNAGYSKENVKEALEEAGGTEKSEEDSGHKKSTIAAIVTVVLVLMIGAVLLVFVAPSAFYFWTSTQMDPSGAPTPRTIVANPVECSTAENLSTTVKISNNSPESREPIAAGALKASGPTEGFSSSCPSSELTAGDNTQCELQNFGEGSGTVTFFGNNIAQTTITC